MRTPSRFAWLAVAGLGVVLSLPCAAQEPDPSSLSGTWVLNLAQSKIDKRFPFTTQTVVITYSAPTIQFHYTSNGQDLTVAFTVDGKEHSFPNPAFKGSETILKATWKKAALVTEHMTRAGPLGYAVTSLILEERWTLSPDGRVLSKKTGSDFDSGHLYVYDKQ